MRHERTRGMTIVGFVNLGVGALFTLIGSLMAFAGGGFMAYSSAKAAGTPGDFIMLIGVATAALNVLLFASGFGVMKVAAWGRSLCMAFGAMGVVIYGAALIGAGFDIFFTAAMVYAFVIIGLFFNPTWKAAFEPSTQAAGHATGATSWRQAA